MAMRKMDLTGQKYGRLTVLKEVKNETKHRRMLCKCDCGNEKEVYMYALRSGTTKSCGCYQRERIREATMLNLAGKKFGRLTVIKQTDKRKSHRSVVWFCKCDCGNEAYVEAVTLQNGSTRSCGWLAEEKNRAFNDKQPQKDGVRTVNLKRKYENKTTGHKGVKKKGNRYQAKINIKNKEYYLGSFKTLEEAIQARKEAELKYHHPYL